MLKSRPATQVDDAKEARAEDFRVVVKQSKRIITSSTFSKRDYSVCKSATRCEIIIKVLERHHNVMLKHNHFPSR